MVVYAFVRILQSNPRFPIKSEFLNKVFHVGRPALNKKNPAMERAVEGSANNPRGANSHPVLTPEEKAPRLPPVGLRCAPLNARSSLPRLSRRPSPARPMRRHVSSLVSRATFVPTPPWRRAVAAIAGRRRRRRPYRQSVVDASPLRRPQANSFAKCLATMSSAASGWSCGTRWPASATLRRGAEEGGGGDGRPRDVRSTGSARRRAARLRGRGFDGDEVGRRR